jgi:phosphatidate cytidylyltransferase
MIPIAAYFFLYELYNLNAQKPFEAIAIVMLGIIYVALPFSLLNYLAFAPNGVYNYEVILGCFVFLWCSDSGAYIVGRAIGKTKTKLLQRISPKKTIEGAVGGVVITILVARFVISRYFLSLGQADWLVIAAIVSIAGIYGDLLESMLKRSFNKKDSGTILPGHGGILDRFDSLILAAPLVYTYIRLFKN